MYDENYIKYLKELSKMFPTIDDAVTEIINLNSILALPRSVEHFMSDLHGQADAFCHILNNASGIFNINGFEYLAYQIFKEHDNRYIESVAFDIQKEMKYSNIIILVNDINRIDFSYFAFGKNQILVIEDNDINREKLKYLHSMRWKELIDKYYSTVHLSEYSFCEYSNNKDKFINTFYFIDTEKINRFRYFINENSTKRTYIICDAELETKLRKELPDANYCMVDFEKYIDKERRYYCC